MNNDLISRKALKEQFIKAGKDYNHECVIEMLSALETIDNAPTALFPLTVIVNDKVTDEHKEILKRLMKDYKPQVLNLETESKADRWIPIVMRPGTDEEYEDFCKYGECPREDFRVFDCPTPDDEQEVFVTTRWGNVCIDIWHRDVDCCYFEDNCDDGDVIAWMPIPEPYKESEGKT